MALIICRRCQKEILRVSAPQKYCAVCALAVHRGRNKQWRLMNPDRVKANSAAWRKANREYIRARAKAYYAANPEKAEQLREKRRQWYSRNKTRIQIWHREFRRSNRVRINLRNRLLRAQRTASELDLARAKHRAYCKDRRRRLGLPVLGDIVKKCGECGTEFKPKWQTAKHCSEKCRKQARRRSSRKWAAAWRGRVGKEAVSAKAKAYRDQNPELVRNWRRRSYYRNYETILRAARRRWQKILANPELHARHNKRKSELNQFYYWNDPEVREKNREKGRQYGKRISTARQILKNLGFSFHGMKSEQTETLVMKTVRELGIQI